MPAQKKRSGKMDRGPGEIPALSWMAAGVAGRVTMVEAPADKPPFGDMGSHDHRPVRFPRRLLRLLACTGNAAVWMLACQALQLGLFATVVAGMMGFLTVVMVFGITRHPQD
jgi:hypothetical protein